MKEDRPLPQAPESEKLVLGSIMSRSAFSEVSEILNPDCFYSPFHKNIYENILKITERGDFPDAITVTNEMRKSGDVNPYEIQQIAFCTTFDHYQHACILVDKHIQRKLIEIGESMVLKAYSGNEDITDIVANATDSLGSLFTNYENNILEMREAIELMVKNVELNSSETTKPTGSKTGFTEFDKRSGGFQKSDLIIIAAESSQGKTSLALSMVRNMAMENTKVALYSLEMRAMQLAARFTSMESGIPANQILYGKFDRNMFERLDGSIGRLLKTGIYIDERSTSNLDTIINSIRTMVAKYGIDGAVIDYLQILNVNEKGKNEEQQMAIAARKLKNLAKELDIWIVALSQLSRENSNPVPTIKRLRGSGQIEEACDVAILIYRPEVYGKTHIDMFEYINPEGTAMIDIAKGRNIGTFKFIAKFEKTTTHFTELGEVEIFNAPTKTREYDFTEKPF